MRKRGVLVTGGMVAVVIALVVLSASVSGSRQDGDPEDWVIPGLGPVLVATQDIQAGQTMDSAIDDGHLEEHMVPLETLVDGAATAVSQIEGKTATRPIGKDEQISLGYLR